MCKKLTIQKTFPYWVFVEATVSNNTLEKDEDEKICSFQKPLKVVDDNVLDENWSCSMKFWNYEQYLLKNRLEKKAQNNTKS